MVLSLQSYRLYILIKLGKDKRPDEKASASAIEDVEDPNKAVTVSTVMMETIGDKKSEIQHEKNQKE